jgi:hypothetical protein
MLDFISLVIRHKLLRAEPPANVGVKLDSGFLPIELEEIPEAAQQSLRAMVDDCSRRSFRLLICHTSEFLGDAESYGANLLHADGKVWLAALWFRVGQRIEAGYCLCSQFADGTILTTTNLRRRSDIPPGMETRSYPGTTLDELWDRHRDALSEVGEQTVASFDAPQLLERLVDIRQRIRSFHLDRGILKPMSRREVARLAPSSYAETNADRTGHNFAEVEEESAAGCFWRMVLRHAWLGLMIGAVLGQYLLFRRQAPQEPGRLEIWLIAFHTYGWALLGGLAGIAFGLLRFSELHHSESAGASVPYRRAPETDAIAPQRVRSA